jgi:hypothetical protein
MIFKIIYTFGDGSKREASEECLKRYGSYCIKGIKNNGLRPVLAQMFTVGDEILTENLSYSSFFNNLRYILHPRNRTITINGEDRITWENSLLDII